MDVLTIRGLSHRENGEYECDIVGLLDVSSDEALTVREANFIKTFAGVRGGEVGEAFLAGDRACTSAIAVVILRRAGKRMEESAIWDYPSGWATYTLGVGDEQEADPTDESETSKTAPKLSNNGGVGSFLTLAANQDDDPSPTGLPTSDTSRTSDLATSAT